MPRADARGALGEMPHADYKRAMKHRRDRTGKPAAAPGRPGWTWLLLILGATAVLLGGQYAWYRASAGIWPGPEEGPRMLRIGLEGGHPPFSSLDKDGRLVGFEPDIARALCERLQFRCTYVVQPWSRMYVDLLDGKYDIAITSMPISPLLAPKIAFSDKLYSLIAMLRCCGADSTLPGADNSSAEIPWCFIARRGADIEPGTPGVRIGIVRWGSYGELLDSSFPDSRLIPYDSLAAAIADLEAGRLDLLLGDQATLDKALLQTPVGKEFVPVGPALMGPGMLGKDAGITVRKEDADLIPAIDRALREIRADGTYRKLNDRYFRFDIYGS
jgi:arginine/ornithine transport system substrate-binding protein